MASTMSLQQTKEQQRARAAWQDVQAVDQRPQDVKKKYRGLVLKLPVMILTNGLGQTLAFLKSKGKGDMNDPHEIVYSHLQNWLFAEIRWTGTNHSTLIERILNTTSETYRQATTETLAYLHWLRRFAEAVLPEPEEGEE
ncbi:type III-B CRISPR module-associated protein Cmr5 [Candidatus Parcubacteria bacterium]|nr:MAG: type III-B CRISPR module-associated protein Cmr5 [Candidatus Parcubacteria bacterium]